MAKALNILPFMCAFDIIYKRKSTPNTIFGVLFYVLSKQLSKLVHHVRLMLHERVGIAIERDGRGLMTEDLGERFHVHATFEGAGGKCVPQGMKAFVLYFQPFQEQFKTSLVGADGNGLSFCRQHEGRITLFLYAFEYRQQLFWQRYHTAGSSCFRLVHD